EGEDAVQGEPGDREVCGIGRNRVHEGGTLQDVGRAHEVDVDLFELELVAQKALIIGEVRLAGAAPVGGEFRPGQAGADAREFGGIEKQMQWGGHESNQGLVKSCWFTRLVILSA